MATLVSTLVDHDYKNWVKGGLALKYARTGIENFVERNIDRFHQDILKCLTTHCYNCSTENIIRCKYNNNFCKFSKNKCKVHNLRDPSKKSRKCPNSVCNVIRNEIVNQHRFHGPSWSKTDSSRWCREPWQLATCYMSDGYKASNSASETDLPGLLAVIINNKVFDTEVTDNLRNKNNTFCKARDARNGILHKADMRLSDAQLAGYIATLDIMLADPKCLAKNPDAIRARQLLQQIFNGTLNVTTRDEATVRADALRAIEDKMDEALTTIDTKEQLSVAVLQKALDEAQRQLKVKEQEAVATLQIVSAKTDKNKMKVLKEELISIYQDGEQLSTSLGTIATDEDKHIDELYVAPNMKLVDHERANDAGRPVKSYQDVFNDGNKKIYVVGEAGTGKTTLCQNMVSTWCKVNIEKIDNMSDNQLAIAKFDYLFYISLRHVITDDTIDEMIKHQLLPNKPSLYEPLSTALEEESCLIILDGLDEWTTENKTATSAQYNKGLPGRDAVRKCSVLTTTRPWKLERLMLKATQIDTMINLFGLDVTSIELLTQNMIYHLNNKFHCKKLYTNFILELNDQELKNLMTIPVILKQIVCLWHSGKTPGTTKCAIYIQMLELLLGIALPRLQKDKLYQQKREEWAKSSLKLPSCFDDYETCQDFKPLLTLLAKLAFQTLLSESTEGSLVFKRTQEGCYGLTSEEVDICLKIGLLSQNKTVSDCTSQLKKISFLHKTYQEFLAALFVSLELSDTKYCVQTIQQFCNTITKCIEMSNVLTFISGICISDITCSLLDQFFLILISHPKQSIITNCMREGWKCSHDNKHLYFDHLYISEPSEYLDQLCQVNIPNLTELYINSTPTAQCLQYLLHIHTLKSLYFHQDDLLISEDLLYDLIHHHRHTLKDIWIERMTLRSNTRLSALLHHVPHLEWLLLLSTTLPQQLHSSLKALRSDTPLVEIDFSFPTILPYAESID